MLRAALFIALAVAALPALAEDELPVLGWRIELHACRGRVCRVLMLPPDYGSAKYPCTSHAAAIQERAAARMEAEPKAQQKLGPWSVKAECLPVRGQAGA